MPLAAVTETVSVFSPSARFVLPVTAMVASASSVIVSTATCLVRAGRLITEPSSTSKPSTLNVVKLVFELSGATTTCNVMVRFATRSGAVTSTITSLFPTWRPVRPNTRTLAAGSRVTAATETDVVLAGRSIVSPSTTSTPFKVREVSAVSADAPPTRTVNS